MPDFLKEAIKNAEKDRREYEGEKKCLNKEMIENTLEELENSGMVSRKLYKINLN